MENEFAHIANTVKIAANFYDICRLCLNQGRLEPLTNISFPLLSFLQVQLNHTLPKNVCEHCLQEMFNFTSFIEKCKHSQNILKQLEIGCEKIKILILVDKKNHEIKNVKSELEPEPIIVNDSEDESETSRNEPSKPDSKKLIDHYKANENSSPTNKKNDEIETVDSKVKLEQFVNDSKDEFETIRNEPSKPASKKLKTCAKCGETVTKMIDHYKANKNCRPTKKISDENVNSKPEPEPGRIVNDSIDESETRRNEPSKPDSKKIKICPKCGDTITKMMDHYKTSRACRPRNFKCAECNISFKSTYYLKSHHLALHEKFLKYMCHICSKMFKFETNLKRHLTVHKLGKMFMCEYCGKGCFRTRAPEKYAIHVRVHYKSSTR
ncbi:zinc finger protein 37-like isoform X2 [Tribolium madens]|uniref:zinc finger protein 37-like isoform X2 n=1 Tax=Tribolium madens TaxID=41895 RepID=UPI001CF740EA|nr:zinc finger protein 37-like isoform X2 [Tribolium madens]